MDPFVALGTLIVSGGLEVFKKFTTSLDGKIGRFIKPVQPVLVLLGGFGFPYIAQALNLSEGVDPAVFFSAPTFTVGLVAARELYQRASRVK